MTSAVVSNMASGRRRSVVGEETISASTIVSPIHRECRLDPFDLQTLRAARNGDDIEARRIATQLTMRCEQVASRQDDAPLLEPRDRGRGAPVVVARSIADFDQCERLPVQHDEIELAAFAAM